MKEGHATNNPSTIPHQARYQFSKEQDCWFWKEYKGPHKGGLKVDIYKGDKQNNSQDLRQEKYQDKLDKAAWQNKTSEMVEDNINNKKRIKRKR